jgi:hypothetical protein
MPDCVEYLYLLGMLPGVIAEYYLKKELRVAFLSYVRARSPQLFQRSGLKLFGKILTPELICIGNRDCRQLRRFGRSSETGGFRGTRRARPGATQNDPRHHAGRTRKCLTRPRSS